MAYLYTPTNVDYLLLTLRPLIQEEVMHFVEELIHSLELIVRVGWLRRLYNSFGL